MSDDDSTDEGLGQPPADDPLVLEVARSRIANALFATNEQVQIGRYRLLDRAGAGGMGVVWSAWDPELERRVAIKLVRFTSAKARDLMLAEGQALAKLSHPNIVPLYDVGSSGEQVYLVMEWISGKTLRAYCSSSRSVKEIVALYLAAGHGLAAAHEAGVVHRDFKPDNVMIGDDRRVRILDFGIAQREDTGGAVAGTPRYMAPEQARGEVASPAADQYSFGVSLRESLRDEPPRWIAAIVARATAEEPAHRFPDMAALLAALERDPARVWRRRAIVAGTVGAIGVAFAIGTQQQDEPDTCGGAPAELAQVWSSARSTGVFTHLAQLGPYGQRQAKPIVDGLTAHGMRWSAAKRGACLARQRGELTPALYESSLACLERSRAALDGVALALTNVTVENLPNAVLAARDLPDGTRCVAEATTDPVAPPPREQAARVSEVGAQVSKARFLALASDPGARALAESAAQSAAALGYARLVAQAQLAVGAAYEPEPTDAAQRAYAAAADAALAAGDHVAFVEAFARQLYKVAKRGDASLAQLTSAVPFVATIAKHTGDAGRFARALLYNNVGSERLAVGDTREAAAWFRRAKDEPEPLDRGVELWAVLGNLAMVVDDRKERDQLFAAERASVERKLGVDHPFTLQVRLRAAVYVEHPGEAAVQLGDVCSAYARLHPHRSDKLASCNYDIAWLAVERGDTAEAQRAYTAMIAQPSDNTARIATAKAELARLSGDVRGALAQAEPIARTAEAAANWWVRIQGADAWLVVAAAHTSLGAKAEAVAALEAARKIFDDPRLNLRSTPVARRRARVVALLALAKRDRALAEEALAWYRSAGGYEAAIAALAK